MRVMIVGGNQMKYVASRYYDYANKLGNGFIRNNHTVVRFYDRDVSRLSSIIRSRKLGVKGANRKLLQQAASLQPDLMIFIHADVIANETLGRLRENHPAARLVQLSIDPLFIPGNVQRLSAKSPLLDATFITTAGDGLKKVSGGRPAYYIPNITDPSIETGRAFDNHCDIDLVFACGSFDREGGDPRKAVLDLIGERLPQINFSRHVDNETGGLWGARYMDALGRSKCGLNMSRQREGPLNLAQPEDLYIYSSDRIAYLTGSGVLAFSHRKYDLDQLFNEDEMVFYDSSDDLVDNIARYLEDDDERRRIAKNGWQKAHRDLNERLAAQYMIDVLFGDNLSHPYIWPCEPVI
jgi:hypothetical protein